MERPTKIKVTKKEDGYEILCWDELSGSGNGIDLPINGYNALAEHFRTGVMEISSDELSGLHKHVVSNNEVALPTCPLCGYYLFKDGTCLRPTCDNF